MTARLRLVASCDAREKWVRAKSEVRTRVAKRKKFYRWRNALAAFGRWIAWPVTVWRRG